MSDVLSLTEARDDRRRCTIEGCSKPHHGHGLCGMHLKRKRRYGDPLYDRYWEMHWAKVDASGDCWLWTGRQTWNGYGQLATHGRHRMAHRYIYERLVGPVPKALDLDHLCRNRLCVNPAHLEPVTRTENMRRAREARHV